MKRRLVVLVSLVLLSLARGGGIAGAALAEDPRELDARAKFALADYQGAAQLFARLYAESGEPIYLRNIGRCFQMMGESQKAISSFEEYLRKARRLSDSERAEVRGFIDDLRRQSATAHPAPPAASVAPLAPAPPKAPIAAQVQRPATRAPAPAPAPARLPVPAPLPRAAPAPLAPPPRLLATTDDAPAPAPAPFYRRWWFWTGVGATAVAVTIVAAATGAFTQTDNAACPDGRRCNP